MSPVIIIATHNRYKITAVNIKSLFPYTVVLVVTDINEAELYRDFDNVLVVMASNEPLGSKWDAGVQYAKEIPHSHIVITGSDDILARGFIQEAVEMKRDFVGLRAWYILHENKLHHVEYLAKDKLPLGGGRVYSRSFLERIGYKIFEPDKSKLLDDKGWHTVRNSLWASAKLIYEPKILAVKGNWEVMNKVNLNHPNVKLINSYEGEEMEKILLNEFNYEYKSE